MAKSIKVNALFKTAMSVVNILFPLLIVPYVSRVLSVDQFTEYNKVQSVLSWFKPFAVFGVYTYGMRTISQVKDDPEKVNQLFSKLFTLSTFFSCLVSLVCVALVFFSGFENKSFYFIAVMQLVCTCFATDYLNEAFESYGFILIKSFVCRILYCGSIFIFVRNENDGWIYILLSTLSVLLNDFLTFVYGKMHVKFRRFKIRELFELIKPLFIVFLLVNASMLYTVFDRFMLTMFSDKLELTFYAIGQNLANTIFQVTSSVVLVSIPRLSNLYGKNREEYTAVLRKTSTFFLLLNIPFCLGLAIVSPYVMYLYSGEKYLAGTTALLYFSVRYVISAFDVIYAKQVFLTTGNEASLTKIYYIGGVVNIIMKFVLYKTGLLNAGTCIITTAVADVFVITMEIVRAKKLGIFYNAFNKNMWVYMILSLVFVPVGIFANELWPSVNMGNVVKGLAVVIGISVVVYAAGLTVTKDENFFAFFKGLKRKKA